MESYVLVKQNSSSRPTFSLSSQRLQMLTAFVLLGCGAGLLMVAIWPLVAYYLFFAPKFAHHQLFNPQIIIPVVNALPAGEENDSRVLSESVYNQTVNLPQESVSSVEEAVPMLSQLASYLRPRPVVAGIDSFTIDVPRVGITQALVMVNAHSYDQALAHLPGSALPGERGNSVIVGHSSLPQFYDTYDYHTIFAKIPELEVGDEILVTLNKEVYRYTVERLSVVEPEQVEALIPPADDRYLTLLTCVPPGLRSQRLLVVASLSGVGL